MYMSGQHVVSGTWSHNTGKIWLRPCLQAVVWTIKEPHLPFKTGLDVTQSHPLCRMRFGQYQASSAVLRWLGDGDCHIIHKMQSGGSKVGRDSQILESTVSLYSCSLCSCSLCIQIEDIDKFGVDPVWGRRACWNRLYTTTNQQGGDPVYWLDRKRETFQLVVSLVFKCHPPQGCTQAFSSFFPPVCFPGRRKWSWVGGNSSS